MANSGLQLLGFVLALLGWVALIAATILPQWRMSSYAGDSIITAVAVYQGAVDVLRLAEHGADPVQGLRFHPQPQLCSPGHAGAHGGLHCVGGHRHRRRLHGHDALSQSGGDNKVQKARIAMTGGLIFVVGGLAALIACSWYGNQIVRDFYDVRVPVNTKYEFGSAIFIGWAGSALVLLGGGLLSCSCPGKSGYKKSYPRSKAVSQPPTNREYV
ncbi:unnamed protein product [Lepidochelys kempii]